LKKESEIELLKKGWSKEDIKKAEDIISSRALHDKSKSMAYSNRILFWTVLFVMIIGNALVALVLIPVLLTINKFGADIFVVVIGFAIGLLFNFLVWDIEEHLTKAHHLIASTAIPILAVINLYAIVRIVNALNDVFKITSLRENPLTISALYVIAFLLPYLWTLFVKKKIKAYQ
jgi:hypothetical protein